MKKVNVCLKQEALDCLKYLCDRKFFKKKTKIVTENVYVKKIQDCFESVLKKQKIQEKNTFLYSYLPSIEQYVFEVLFCAGIHYEEDTFLFSKEKFLFELFEENYEQLPLLLSKSKYTSEEQVIILSIYYNFEQYTAELEQTIRKILLEIEPEFQNSLFKERMTDFQNFQLAELKIPLVQAKRVVLSFFQSENIRYNQSEETILLGLLHLYQFVPQKEEDATEILKFLCDSTKYAILKELATEPTYQRVLAQKLQLTSATIAHHISFLLEKNIIISKVVKNKIYFELNHSKIENIIKKFGEGLLGKDKK